MCTAVSYKVNDLYFGRTFDYEASYGEEIVFMPRKYPFNFRYAGSMQEHFALIGMAHMAENIPLYYDAMNEKGLCMAGLNFVGNACYSDKHYDGDNILQSEFIPWILGQCTSVKEARQKLDRICMLSESFNDKLPVSSLHWIISDKEENITVEFMKDGLHIYDNPVGVLTNNPPFETQMFLLNQYMGLSASQPDNRFSGKDRKSVV